jgi:sugar O-acyltransferase (sialic acid O-acetyltransferase NeuD family)
MAKIIIFGTGDIAQLANYYFEIDSEHEVVAFTVDKDFCTSEIFEGKPLVAFEEIESLYPAKDYKLFIALSYAQLNKLREKKFCEAKNKGYELVSYISSKCTFLSQYPAGENSFILENNTIQPFVKIGDNVTLWSGNHIGHHSIIESHCFVSSHVVISGHCVIKSYTFLGVNSTIGHQVTIQEGTIVGSGSSIIKDTEANSVIVPSKSIVLSKKSNEIKL